MKITALVHGFMEVREIVFKLYARKNELAVRDREPLTSGSVNVNRVDRKSVV